MYAVLDVETTGLNSLSDKIIEIAIFLHDGERVTDKFETLVNPEKRIPYQVTGITGISNKMVVQAPPFYEVARSIVEMTEDRVLVGHNVAFDYAFLRNEFKRLFYKYQKKTLCTKKLSRKLIPGLKSYGLGSLCRELNINNPARHRAGGDASSTVRLLEHLLSLETDINNATDRGYNSGINKELIDNLPNDTGVYYFLNKENDIVYVGKSTHIRDRIISHMNNNATRRAIDMRDQSADIHYELTGSELIALLLESYEIKKHKPLYNRAQRRSLFQYGLFDFTDRDGYLNLEVRRITSDDLPLTSYTSQKEGREHLNSLIERYDLCQKLCGLYKSRKACFNFHIHKCRGACAGIESFEEYNLRVNEAIEKYLNHSGSYFIIDEGRHKNERGVVQVENGRYMGYGYIDINEMHYASAIRDCIKPFPDNKDVQIIIKGFLRRDRKFTLLKIE